MANETSEPNWCSRSYINYEKRKKKCMLENCDDEHPLKSLSLSFKKSSEISIIDPLGAFIVNGNDPLSRPVQLIPTDFEEPCNIISDNCQSWSQCKQSILNNYTTSEKLTFKSYSKTIQSATIRSRLEELDEFDDQSDYSEKELCDLTQQEFVAHMDNLSKEIVDAWNNEQRVKALKIIIQCTKILSYTSPLQFYPSKFVLVTDLLDLFGDLVYKRLKSKSEIIDGQVVHLPNNFTPDMVPISAKETCRNWFFKIASIRELIPRLYIEAAILQSYQFIKTDEQETALMRLIKMVRGIGHPLVAWYARCYLCRVGSLIKVNINYFEESIKDILLTYKQINSRYLCNEIQCRNMTMDKFLQLLCPALEWIIKGLCTCVDTVKLDEILKWCILQNFNGLLINSIVNTFPGYYIAQKAEYIVNLISNWQYDVFPQTVIVQNLGISLRGHNVPNSQNVLREVWKLVTKIKDTEKYMACAEAWIYFIVKHFKFKEINIIISDITRHLSNRVGIERFHTQLHNILQHLLNYVEDFENIFLMNNLLPYLDMFGSDINKSTCCKTILEAYRTRGENVMSHDPVINDCLMYMCKILHDSVDSLMVEDEVRQISRIIACFIFRVDYNDDLDKHLNFYMEARGAFIRLDYVQAALVQCVNKLMVKSVSTSRKLVKNSFARACSAYCYITIPSITSPLTKLQLYLLTGQTSLLNGCLGQADACFKAASVTIKDFPVALEIDGHTIETEFLLITYIQNFLSILLIVPDCPDQEVLHQVRTLINSIRQYSWTDILQPYSLYLHVLDMLSIATLDTYPYKIAEVDSNDVLYGREPQFVVGVDSMCTVLLNTILEKLNELAVNPNLQSKLGFELFMRIMIRADLNNVKMTTLAINLWKLSKKQNTVDIKTHDNMISYLCDFCNNEEEEIYHKVAKKIAK
ncbi:VPS35 endosomal protein-sorting factor-like [Daktulosphaira vitifoliae]|uniref:VPS35 endosomal protein-sorting factor-like n=1 Tax=Daktulosphaira vitifoliae TaxID=58002 RepID=UPI0021AA034B|nr:VPS35 endosomal protein-sorting factor-like [Daktulosphaira vitifoliae]